VKRKDLETKQLKAGTSVTLPRLLDFKLEINTDDTQFLFVELPASNCWLVATSRSFA
jgi:hypothetical protein